MWYGTLGCFIALLFRSSTALVESTVSNCPVGECEATYLNARARHLIVHNSTGYGSNLLLRHDSSERNVYFKQEFRSLSTFGHIYYVNYKHMVEDSKFGWSLEGYVANIVSSDNYPYLKDACPRLKHFMVFHNTVRQETWLSEPFMPNPVYKLEGQFWCAPWKGYCGANFEIVSIARRHATDTWDLFTPSSNEELGIMLNVTNPDSTWENKIFQKICWAWQ